MYKMMTRFLIALFAVTALAHAAHAKDNNDSRMAGTQPVAGVSKPIVDNDPDAKKGAPKPKIKTTKKSSKVAQASAPAIAPKQNYVGKIETYRARGDDTLQSIGERESLGYVELRAANPSMDPWRPGAGRFIILPKMHLLPDGPRKGIVVNLPEMRLYYYQSNGEVATFPIGVGREGFSTPTGSTNIVSKTKGPTWRPTPRMLREDPSLKPFYGPGPDNPLGTYALYLGWPEYRLHGTNKPWGIGRRVSSGCIRMYNESAEYLFGHVPVGTPVTTVRQPIKFAWIGDMLYIEAHADGMLADQMERGEIDYRVPDDLFADLSRAAGKSRDDIDWKAVREALRDRRGYPVPILLGAREDQKFVTDSMMRRAGTERVEDREVVPPSGNASAPVPVPAPGNAGSSAGSAGTRRSMGGFNS